MIVLECNPGVRQLELEQLARSIRFYKTVIYIEFFSLYIGIMEAISMYHFISTLTDENLYKLMILIHS